MFDWLNTRDVEDFAKVLIQEFSKRFPPEMETSQDKKHLLKLANTLDALHARSKKFSSKHKLGIYKKAKLGNILKWEMKELGYSDLFIDQMIKKLMIGLATH
ncbi:MAG: hypothetical protein ACYC2R_06440 [Burkholderiales bacterium]